MRADRARGDAGGQQHRRGEDELLPPHEAVAFGAKKALGGKRGNEQLHSLWVGEDRPRAGVSVELQPNGLDLGLKMLLRLRSWLSSTQVEG